jgi:glycosyltransferase involved in cell wall biosynthesis
MSAPFVSVIVPCRNEEAHIGACLDSIVANDYPADRLEILVAEGGSSDRTRELIAGYAAENSSIRLLNNPGGTTPTALNLAITAASGEIIIRMDAHVWYPRNYIRTLVAGLLETGADNVGGVIETVPADHTATAKAIAIGLSHSFGVGNSYFRTGTDRRREVDTVPFGCFRREVFERIGLFDEELVRNQDDELNFRLLSRGGRILLLPEVRCRYTARRSLAQLARMYYQYGYFKPLVARKVGRIMTLRQLMPALLLSTLVVLATLSLWFPLARAILLLVSGVYGSLVFFCAAGVALKQGPRCATALIAVFPVLHFSYGFGFIRGVLDHCVSRATPGVRALSLSR